ncbi:rhodanese-like domain-containing protein [Cellulomonas soli]
MRAHPTRHAEHRRRPAPGGQPGTALRTLSAPELAALLSARERGEVDVDVVDVRERAEHDLVAIPGARLLPLSGLRSGEGLASLDPARPLVLHCKVGQRSAEAGALLQARGFADVRHLAGGILAWIDEVDPSLPATERSALSARRRSGATCRCGRRSSPRRARR